MAHGQSLEHDCQITRRTLLQAMTAAYPAFALVPFACAQPTTGLLRVTIWPPEGRRVPENIEVLARISDEWVPLSAERGSRIFERRVDAKRTYTVVVRAPDYRTIERLVAVDDAIAATRVYLAPTNWPYYFASGIEIPFEPRPRLAAVAMARLASEREKDELAHKADELGLMRVTLDPTSGAKLDEVNGSVMYFVPKNASQDIFSFNPETDPDRSRVSAEPIVRLKKMFEPFGGRVGSPSEITPGEVSIVDNEYLVRFAEEVNEDAARRFAESVRARVTRPASRNWPFWTLVFDDPQNLGRHLAVVSRRRSLREIVVGEPDLLFQFEPPPQISAGDQGPIPQLVLSQECEVLPDKDPYESCQANLSRQRVQEAWCHLEQTVEGGRYGSSDVKVVSFDTGITVTSPTTTAHPDIDESNLIYCYDLMSKSLCGTGADHGMGVYGIIAGEADNNAGISGIAPKTSHIAINGSMHLIQAASQYTRALLWLGGFDPPDGVWAGSGATPPPKPDIINCSHGRKKPYWSALDVAIKKLATDGRDGLGIVIVYATGNDDRYIPDHYNLATHPNTIGVGNTHIESGKEVRQFRPETPAQQLSGSNYGPFIDLCANGDHAPTLLAAPGDTGEPPCNGDDKSGNGVQTNFGGTSAAAAMVSGAAALVLTANGQLTAKQVRQILCATAEKIDCQNTMDEQVNGLPRRGKWRPCDAGATGGQSMPCASVTRGLDWFSDFYGYGRLDVLEAVKMAKATLPQPPPCDLG